MKTEKHMSEKQELVVALVDSFTSVLRQMIGETVIVCWSSIPATRNGFHSQVNVGGKLEGLSEGESFRVLVTNDTYAYVWPEEIHIITSKSDGTPVLWMKKASE